MPPRILTILGPTASGKTRLAVELALMYNGEVVSADSMQIYRRMDIGTAKPTRSEMRGVPHHMLDVADPEEDFSVARYVQLAVPCIEDILSRGRLPILAGGTGLYIDSLLSGRTFAAFSPENPLRRELEEQFAQEGGEAMLAELARVDPDSARKLHPNDAKRIIRALEVYRSTGRTIAQHNRETQALPPRYEALYIGLRFQDRAALWARIARRADRLESLAISLPGKTTVCLPMDLCDPMSFVSLKDRLAEEKPEVSLLVNCAGCGYLGRVGEMDTASQTRMVDLNVRALTAVTNLVLPYMPEGGHILNVSSIASFCPNPRMTVYSSTKAYVSHFTVGLNEELRRRKQALKSFRVKK